jgi:hypothetical protein
MRRPALLAALLASLLPALLLAAGARANDQIRTTPPFTAIDMQGAISLTVDTGARQTLAVTGNDRFINGLSTDVVDGVLRIRVLDKELNRRHGEQHIAITMPALRALTVEGAGVIKLNNIRGERLDVDYQGAGKMDVSGAVKTFRMKAEGVGQVDARALVADDVDVHFEGVGGVRVHARHRLDANVQGMGSLTYYGRPQIVNKTAEGLGKVSAGD